MMAEDSSPITDDEGANISEEEPTLAIKEKFKLFLSVHWQGLVSLLTPIILILLLIPFPPQKYQWCAYTLVLMAVYWVTEVIPLPITSFLPVMIFPMVGVMTTEQTCKCYMNDTIVMFLGSLMLAYAVEQSGLHRRLALNAIKAIGYSHYRLLFATSFTTMFVSMWITNTAATTMMVPITFAVLKVFEDLNLLDIYDTDSQGNEISSDITACYFCSATFSATIGGIGTLVGSATNLVFKGLFIRPKSDTAKNTNISKEGQKAAKIAVEKQIDELGKITFWEIMVIILFTSAMVLFFSRSPQIFKGWGDKISEYFDLNDMKFVRDSAAAMFICFLMMLLPSTLDIFKNCYSQDEAALPNKPIRALLDWKELNNIMPYGFMFLLGGGFALSEASKLENSNLNGKIGDILKNLQHLPNVIIILLIVIFTIFVTNFASNVAVCNVIAPIVMQMAKEINCNPLWYNIAAGFSASYCLMLPVGTPGNLIVQSAAKIPTGKMIKAGVGPTISTTLLTWIAICFWAPVIWPSLHSSPDWIYKITSNSTYRE